MRPLSLATAALLVAAALAARVAAPRDLFYLFLLGIPLSGAAALTAFGALVDAAERGTPTAGARLHALLAGALVAVFVGGAAARSPVSLDFATPGLARLALALGLVVLALQALAALVRVRR